MATSASVLQSVAGSGQQAPADAGSSKDVLKSVATEAAPNNQMVTPDGKVIYATSDQIPSLKESGHTLINPDKTFQVEPMKGEDITATMRRATKVSQALTEKERTQGMQAEIQSVDPRPQSMGGSGVRGAANLAIKGAVVPMAVGAAGTGLLTGAGEAIGAAGEALGDTELVQLLRSSPKLYAEYILKTHGAEVASTVGKAMLKGAAAYLGLKWMGKMMF